MRHFFLQISKLLISISITISAHHALASSPDLPDLARYDNERSLSNPSYVLGQYWFRKINGSRGLIEFPPAYNYLRQAIADLVPNTGLNDKTIELALLNSRQMNAFVIPGSHLFIYSDILRLINNENMFMGLLAHEISHLELHHYQRSLENQRNEQAKSLLLLLAGAAAATVGDIETTSALWLGGLANQQENILRYSRSHEQEADRRGRELLQQSGLPTSGMNDLLAGLMKESMGSNRIEFLSTHPLPQSRLSDSLTGEDQQSILFQPSSPSFQFFRATLLAYRAALESTGYQSFLRRNINADDEYYYALTLTQLLLHYNESALENLRRIKSRNEFTDYLKVIIYLTVDKKEEAQSIVHNRLSFAPEDLTFQYLAGQLDRDLSYLQASDSQLNYQNRMVYRHNIAVAQQQNDSPYALFNHALLEFQYGKELPAMNLINRSIRQSSGTKKQQMETVKLHLERILEAQKREGLD